MTIEDINADDMALIYNSLASAISQPKLNHYGGLVCHKTSLSEAKYNAW